MRRVGSRLFVRLFFSGLLFSILPLFLSSIPVTLGQTASSDAAKTAAGQGQTGAGGASAAGAAKPSSTQTPAAPANGRAGDYSAEPYVIEKTVSKLDFQSDGTYTTDDMVRVRLQSQAGIQQFGIVSEAYASGTTTMQMAYARATKPDGRVIETPAENVLDLPAQITQQVPFYSDLKVLQAAVKGLSVGDTLEYEFRATTKPIDPGQFWFEFNFFKSGVVLDQELQISVPSEKYVKVKSPDFQSTTEQKDGRTTYFWKTSHLEGTGASPKDAPSPPKHADLQLTTFHNWSEVGAWFDALAAPQAVPTPDVRAKAQELTSNAKTDQEKIQALYNFVSTKYRYIGIDFGIGRYQPHAAADVMSNDYGDCKDKHTLFAALLASVGINAYPVLIGTESDLDADVPSPAQFDHVITAIPQGSKYQFLDTTPEVAPYGYLIAAIRDKQALVIPDPKTAALVQTPADPPFKSFFDFQSDGSLTDQGEYDGKMHMSMRGDAELAFRIALRQVGESQWNTAIQALSSSLGFGGTVSDGSISQLETPDKPLELNYSYKRERIGDWDNKQLSAPLPPVDLSAAPDESTKNPQPIKLGSAIDEDMVATIKLPSDASPQLPEGTSLTEAFADYQSTYSVSSGVLRIERKLSTKAREVSPDQFDAYRKFVKAVQEDEIRFVPVYNTAASSGASSNPEAQLFFNRGLTARNEGDMAGATDDFKTAVAKDPNFAEAWAMLGFAHVQAGDRTQGVGEMKKAAALAPSTPAAKYIARSLEGMRLVDDSLEVWRSIEKQNPQDAEAPLAVGSLLMGKKQYADALPELQTAAKLDPSKPLTLVAIGEAYIRTGDLSQGLASMHKGVALDHSQAVLNDAAYDLANDKVDLDEALQYAQDAVKGAEGQTSTITLDKMTLKDFQSVTTLSYDWDTLGWVEFQLGHNDAALDYLNAAWNLGQDSVVAYHIGQVYEKEGKTHEAVIAYSRAVSVVRGDEDAEQRLNALRPNGKFLTGEGPSVIEVQNMRTIELIRFYEGSASATFNVLIAPGSKVLDVKFVKGSEALRDTGELLLKAAHFNAPIPDGSVALIVRQGVLDCETAVPKCTFVMIPPDSVRVTN